MIAGCIEIYMPIISNHTKYINQKLFVNSFHLMYRKVVLKTQKKQNNNVIHKYRYQNPCFGCIIWGRYATTKVD